MDLIAVGDKEEGIFSSDSFSFVMIDAMMRHTKHFYWVFDERERERERKRERKRERERERSEREREREGERERAPSSSFLLLRRNFVPTFERPFFLLLSRCVLFIWGFIRP